MSDEGGSSFFGLETSMLLRELERIEALNATGDLTDSINSSEIGASGDATNSQLMRTMYNSQPKQKIVFTGNDEQNSFGVFDREVDIFIASKEDSSQSGSNKVKIKNIVNHAWEQRYYFGQLVAVHRDEQFVAFSLKGKSSGCVRILHTGSSDRVLVKGFSGNVLDVAFAYTSDVVIAAIDDLGNLLVYACELSKQDEDSKIIATPLLHLKGQGDKVCMYHRVIWCPYWPEEDIENEVFDTARMLAYTDGRKIELLALDVVSKDYEAGPLSTDDIKSGKITLVSHKDAIMEAVFSPDGSALATASLDGEVKFFQIDWNNPTEKPTCLHNWEPHGGQALSFFTFLDDVKNVNSDTQFWKFAVTGCNKNRELKVWSCETWTCLQTISFLTPPDRSDIKLSLKAGIDMTARYILLCDRLNMGLYVLQVHQDPVAGRAHISSVSHFHLAQSFLTFAIIDTATKKLKSSLSEPLDEITTGELEGTYQAQSNGEEDAGESIIGVQIRLYAIHPRAMQELQIRYRPVSTVSLQSSADSVSHDGTSIRDGLSDVSTLMETSLPENEEVTLEDTPAAPQAHPQPKLLSPDAFARSTSSKMMSPTSGTGANSTMEEALSSTSSFTHVTGLTGQNAEDLLLSPVSSADQSASAAAVLSPKSQVSAPSPISVQSPKTPGSAVLSPKAPVSVLSPKAPVSVLSPKTPSSALRSPQTPGSGVTSPKSVYATPSSTVGADVGEEVTPFNLPLPPEEEDELATPMSSFHSNDSSQLEALEAFFKPGLSTSLRGSDIALRTGTFEVDALIKESPTASVSARESLPPTDTYDENDQEVAEVLGEEVDQSYSSMGSGGPGTATDDYSMNQTMDDDQADKPWPRPPDVPSTAQGGPGVSSQPCPQGVDEVQAGGGDTEDNDSEDQNEAEVEEEIEEVIEAENEDDGEADTTFQKSYQEMVNADSVGQAPVQIIREVADSPAVSVLQESIGKLTQEVFLQQQKLNHLQQLIQDQHEMQVEMQRQQIEQASLRSTAHPTKDLEQQLGRVQNVVASRVERTLSTTLQKEMRSLHDKLSAGEAKQAAFQESLQKNIIQAVSSTTQKNLDNAVKNEFKHFVTPALTRSVEQLKNQLHTEMSQKLTATDSVIKDQIGKMIRSRQTTETISQAVSSSMHSQSQVLMRDIFTSRVIPAFEITSRSMMNQINSTFQEGTTEYLGHLRKQLEKVRQEQVSARDPLISQLTELVESVKHSSQQMNEQMLQAIHRETNNQITDCMNSFQEQLQIGLRKVIREEVGHALKEQGNKMTDSLASYLRSGAGTPIPGAQSPDVNSLQSMQDQVKLLVTRGMIDRAFQQALSASNLDLVVYVCELVDPAEIFARDPCVLNQPVLLSLIQQLSAELSSSFTTKLKYLTGAVTILDPKDPRTQEHISTVLSSLVSKLRTYQASHPPNKDVRLLFLAATSLLTS